MKKTMFWAAVAVNCGILMFGCSDNVAVVAQQQEESVAAKACKPHAPWKQVINADPFGKVTLQGYDAVAFHTQGAAMRGNPYIYSEFLGYKYLFASEENKSLFDADPEKYLPAFGGFCAFGVSLGVLFPVEIGTWVIIDGRLILQFSNQFRQLFEENLEENLLKADSTWQEIVKKKPKHH